MRNQAGSRPVSRREGRGSAPQECWGDEHFRYLLLIEVSPDVTACTTAALLGGVVVLRQAYVLSDTVPAFTRRVLWAVASWLLDVNRAPMETHIVLPDLILNQRTKMSCAERVVCHNNPNSLQVVRPAFRSSITHLAYIPDATSVSHYKASDRQSSRNNAL